MLKKNLYIIIGYSFLTFGQLAIAESQGRIIERLGSDWKKPNIVDYDDFVEFLDPLNEDEEDQIESLLEELDDGLDKIERAEVLAKLGDLYIQESRDNRFDLIENYKKKYSKWLNSKSQLFSEKPILDLSSSLDLANKATQTYRVLFNEYPKFNRNPKLIFRMANLQLLTSNPNAVLFYNKLNKKFGKKGWKTRANIGLGEFYFENENYAKAKQYYGLALKDSKKTDLSYINYAKYKLAWISMIAMTRKKTSIRADSKDIEYLKTIILSSEESDVEVQDKYLAKQAEYDLVWFWSETSNAKDAYNFFKIKLNKKQLFYRCIERSAWKNRLNDNPKKASYFTHILLKEEPYKINNIKNQMLLIELFHKKKKPYKVLNEVQFLVKKLTNNGKSWSNKVEIKTKKEINRFIYSKALYYHNTYLSDGNHDYLKVANLLYAINLLLFPKVETSLESRFKYAKTLELLNKNKQAVAQYHKVAKTGLKGHQIKKEQSAERMVEIQRGIVAKEIFPKLDESKISESPATIPIEKKRLVEVIDTHLEVFKDKKNQSEISFLAAEIIFQYGFYKQALKRFESLLEFSPNSNELRKILYLLANFFESRKEWERLRFWLEEILKQDQKLKSADKEFLIQKLKLSMWNIAIVQNKMNKKSDSINSYIKYQQRFPKDKQADLALFQAMSVYFLNGEGEKGINIGQDLIRLYPNSKYNSESIFKIANTYQSMNKFREAAETFELLAKRYPNDEKAPEIIYKSSQIYQSLNNLDRAALLLNIISSNYLKSNLAPKALLEEAELHLKLEQFEQAEIAFSKYIKIFSDVNEEESMYAMTQLAILNYKNNRRSLDSNDIREIEKDLSIKNKSYAKKSRMSLEELYFELIDKSKTEFFKIKVAYYDFNEYENSISRYLNEIEKIEVYFKRLNDISSLEGLIKSHYILGTIYEKTLENFVREWNMNGLAKSEVDNILNAKERIIITIREKMIDQYLRSLNKAKSSEILTVYRRKSAEKLSKIAPEELEKVDL